MVSIFLKCAYSTGHSVCTKRQHFLKSRTGLGASD